MGDSWTAPGISVSLIDVSATIHLYPDEPTTKTTQTYDGAVGKQQPHKCYTPVLHVTRNLTIDDRPTTRVNRVQELRIVSVDKDGRAVGMVLVFREAECSGEGRITLST